MQHLWQTNKHLWCLCRAQWCCHILPLTGSIARHNVAATMCPHFAWAWLEENFATPSAWSATWACKNFVFRVQSVVSYFAWDPIAYLTWTTVKSSPFLQDFTLPATKDDEDSPPKQNLLCFCLQRDSHCLAKWNALLLGDCLHVEVPDGAMPVGSKEWWDSLAMSLLQYPELQCDQGQKSAFIPNCQLATNEQPVGASQQRVLLESWSWNCNS